MKLALETRYRAKNGDVWHVFREMGGLFAAKRESDGIVDYFYPSGRASHPLARGRALRLRELVPTERTAVLPLSAVLSSTTVLQEPPASGTITIGSEPATDVHVTIEQGTA